jgi:hypothetical protein
MVRKASTKDIYALAEMLQEMAREISPEHAAKNPATYLKEVQNYLEDETLTVYVDDGLRGFFIVKDDFDAVFPTLRRVIGTKVYIKPKYRHTHILKRFYDKLFEDFAEYEILGLTEIDSPHIPVLEKRHKRVANVYVLNHN